jgi:hypothetical protein
MAERRTVGRGGGSESRLHRGTDYEERGGYTGGPTPEVGTPPVPPLFMTPVEAGPPPADTAPPPTPSSEKTE